MVGDLYTVAVVGGTGNLGPALAYRLARVGHPVIIGSRKEDKARAAAELVTKRAGMTVRGMQNEQAAAAAEIVIITVPFAHHATTLRALRDAVQGKIVVDTTVPLQPPRVARAQIPPEGCAAVQAQAMLGDAVRVVSAFQNVAAEHLQKDRSQPDCDVLVCGNNPEAREVVVAMAEAMGLKAWHAGAIQNSLVAEAMTSVLIFINKRYKIAGAGIRITGEPGESK